MRVLIAGAGRGGLGVAVHLRGLGHAVTIVDIDGAVALRASEEHGIVALTGDATDASLVRAAEAGKADVVVAMLHRDADNLAVALLARVSGARRVMVRMRDPAYREIYEKAGVNRVLSETDVLVGAFATSIEHEPVRHSMVLGGGRTVVFELRLPDDAKVAGRTVSELAGDKDFPPSCVLAGLFENGAMEAPRGASTLEGGMDVLLVAKREELAAVVAFFMR